MVLAAAGADPNLPDNEGWRPLHLAAMGGHLRASAVLLDAGAQASARSVNGVRGTTPLLCAIVGGDPLLARLLLAFGAEADAIDDAGFAPIHLAVELGHIEIVKLLLASGAQREPIVGEHTPLDVALRRGDLRMASFLRMAAQ